VDFFKKLKVSASNCKLFVMCISQLDESQEFRPEPSLDDDSYPVTVNQLIDDIKSENDAWKEGQKIEVCYFIGDCFWNIFYDILSLKGVCVCSEFLH